MTTRLAGGKTYFLPFNRGSNPDSLKCGAGNPQRTRTGRKLIEDLMIQRMADNDDIVTRYMDDDAFQGAAFPILTREIFEAINLKVGKKRIEDLIAGGESATLEFKSTLRTNLYTKKPDEKMEHAVLKTVAAFLNSKEGGTLLIGVADSGKILGSDADNFPNEDKMGLHFANLVKSRMGVNAMLRIKQRFETVTGKRVLRIDCDPGNSPTYIKFGTGEEFYIRTGPATASLSASEMTAYIRERF